MGASWHLDDVGERGEDRVRPGGCFLVAGTSAVLLLAFHGLAPLIPAPPAVAYVVGYVMVMGCVLATAWVAPTMGRSSVAAVALPVIGVLVTLWLWGESIPTPLSAVAVTGTLLVGGGVLGGAVGGRIEQPGHLVAVAVISLLVDTFSVYHPVGPTATIVAQPELLAVLALPWPMLGGDEIVPVLGIGDVVFAALYLSASRRHGLGIRRTTVALAAGLMVTMIAVLLSELPVPALIGMGLAVLAAHPEARRLPPSDRRLGRTALAVLALLWIVAWVRTLIASSSQ